MKLSSFATALATMGLMPFTTSQSGVCFDPNGGSVGPSGQQKDLKNSSKIILFERKGEEQCGCSYVSYDPLICMLDIVTMPLIYHHSKKSSREAIVYIEQFIDTCSIESLLGSHPSFNFSSGPSEVRDCRSRIREL